MSSFISLVGFQVMAVLNPLVSINGITKAYLLHTKKSLSSANTIKDYLNKEYSDIKVELKEIETKLTEGNAPQKLIKKIVNNTPDDTFYFNLAGGMNYHIAACLIELFDLRINCIYVYPESEGIRKLSIDDKQDVKEEKIFIKNIPITDILALQKIPYEIVKDQNLKGQIQKKRFSSITATKKINSLRNYKICWVNKFGFVPRTNNKRVTIDTIVKVVGIAS